MTKCQIDKRQISTPKMSVLIIGNFLHFFLGLFREKQNHTITEECPDCCLAKHEGNQMSGLGEDTFPKSKSRPPCSWPVNGGACSIAFVSGLFVLDSARVLQQHANKAWREKENAFKTNCRQFQGRRKKEERPADGRSSGPCASAPSSSDREPVKKGSKSWSTTVCDCLEKETKTVILSDNSNEPELRARNDEATTTRCRKEKLLHLRQRCMGSAVVHGRSIPMHIWHSQPFHGVTGVLLAGGCNLTGPQNIVAEINPLYARVETNCSFVISNSSSSNERIFEYFRIPDRKVVANPIFKIPIGQEVSTTYPNQEASCVPREVFSLRVLF